MKLHKIFRLLLWSVVVSVMPTTTTFAQTPFYPTDICTDPQGNLLVAEKGTKKVVVYTPDGKRTGCEYHFNAPPTGLIDNDGRYLYVTTFETQGQLHVIDRSTGKTVRTINTGSGACAPILNPDKTHLYVCNQFQNTVSEIDLNTNECKRTVEVLREPRSAVMSTDGRFLFVANFLPAQRADVDYVAACVSVIDLKRFKKIKDIRLANGSNALRDICITPDGRYIYVSHNLGRYTVPTSQLQQGWMNTSAISVINAKTQEFQGVVIVDEPERGAAGVWGIACDEKNIYLSHSGTHEISIIRHQDMLRKFQAYPDKERLEYDLTFLYGLRRRIPLEGNGPRAILLAGGKLYVPTYFADILNTVDTQTGACIAYNLNPNRQETDRDRGERCFNDASHCFQNWQSCNGCHPGDARTDGMNWDLMNDGVGNSKNCKSMLFSHVTPPSMISGVRESAEWAVRAGFRFIQFFEVNEEDARCVDAYLKSLRPVPSPWLVDGKLSEKAQQGKKVFEQLRCGSCHSGPYFTDCQMHRIGDDVEFEKGWDTPTLREVWRTAPYLFDGRAATMREVFEVHRHGIDRKVSKKDIEALTEYVNSL